jgi:rod shape determining protein RodA
MAIALGRSARVERARAAEGGIGVRARLRDFDLYMFLTTLVLMGFGIVAIWSAEGQLPITSFNLGTKQAFYGLLGLVLMFVVASVDYRYFSTLAWPIYFGALGVLAMVLVVGTVIAGSQRWFIVGPISIQPSEFGKVATIIALAAFISSRGPAMREFGNFVVSGLIALAPMALVFRQPDLGTTLVYGVIWISMILMAQTRTRYLMMLVALAVPAFFVAWEFLFLDYQKDRLLVSYNPARDPLGEGFNIEMARISVGSGGWFGAGLSGGTQSLADLLRVRTTDFIFAHASGMFGYLGMLALLLSFAILLWRCLNVVETSRDGFGRLVATGVAGALFFQAFVNIGMNIGLMPVTGITLPFVSAGSSSLWTFLLAEGLLQSIRMRHRKLAFQAR